MADWTNTRLNLRYRWKTVLIWGIGIVGTLVFAFWTMSERADAWVQGFQPFPKGEATVVLHRFCRTPPCEALPQAEWHQLIRSVITEWNNAGSAFRFHERAVQSTDDPCRPQQGHVYVLVADPAHVCPGDSPLRSSGRTEYDQGWSRVYISTWFLDAWVQDGNRRRFLLHLRRLLLHEFGHVVGLGHPDEAGQVYPAVVNGDALLQDHLTFDDIAGIQALYPVGGENPTAGILEIPGPNATVSGIGVISGWKCHAGELTVRFDGGGPIPLLYGAERKDVLNAGACGDADVGFVSIWNWGNLSDGPHVAVVYDDGVEFDRSTFTVVTTGEAFLQGASGECVVEDFPASGEQGRFLWNEATQHMELAEVSGASPPPPPSSCTPKAALATLDGLQVAVLNQCDGNLYIDGLSWDSFVCGIFFSFEQGGMAFSSSHFALAFDPCAGDDGRTPNLLTLTVNAHSSLDLRKPFRLSYNGSVLFTFP